MPEHDALAVPGPRPDGRDETGQRLGRVDRVDEDRLGPGEERGGLRGGRGRSAVAVAELASRRARCRRARSSRRGAATVSAISGRSSAAGRATTTPVTRVGGRTPTSRPAWVPPVADGSTIRSIASPTSSAWAATSRPASTWPHAPTTDEPPVPMTYGWPPAASTSSATRRTIASRSARSAVASWWIVAPNARATRMPGPGGSAGGPDSTRWTASPALAPAAAVRRAWLDQRRPLVTSVSQPSASAAPTRNSRLRSLLPPNASGNRSSRLTQTSVPPPRAAENRGSGWSG